MNKELIDAAENGDLRRVQNLLEAGADPNNARDVYDNTPLMFAAMRGHLHVVKKLIEVDADPNATGEQGDTPLMWAVRGEKKQFILPIVKALILAGAKLNTQTVYYLETALFWAVRFSYIPIIKELVKKGADPTLADYRGVAPINSPIYRQAVQELAEEEGLVQLMLHRNLPLGLGMNRYLYK